MLHTMHRLSAIVIGLFIILHLGNHLFIVNGVQAHLEVMTLLRHFYRNPVFESLLLACIVFQLASGLYFFWRGRKNRSGVFATLQAYSGLYLVYFLFMHVSAVLFARNSLHVDTNLFFAIAGIHAKPFQYYFIPYYVLAVMAVFVHPAAAMVRLNRTATSGNTQRNMAIATMAAGLLLALILALGFSGAYFDISIPEEYSKVYS